MRKSHFTEAQSIGVIKEQEGGFPTAELSRKHGLGPATFYKLKATYGGMDLSGVPNTWSIRLAPWRLRATWVE